MKKAHSREPAILRTNLKFVNPASTPAQRRFNEKLRINQVSKYLEWLEFSVVISQNSLVAIHPNGIRVSFTYRESEKAIQKIFNVSKGNNNKSNITLLRKMYPK